MLQAYEGYLENGQVHPIGAPVRVSGRRRVVVTILDEQAEKADTWGELDRIIAEMDEKPLLENFPRCALGRELVSFDEV